MKDDRFAQLIAEEWTNDVVHEADDAISEHDVNTLEFRGQRALGQVAGKLDF